MNTTTETRLDAMLAPLDTIARGPLRIPTQLEAERAYALGLLAAELCAHGAVPYILDCAERLGVPPEDALTIARAFSSAIVRVSQSLRG